MTWHRSPILWFVLPGLIFLIVAWIDSMSHVTSVEAITPPYSLDLDSGKSVLDVSWYNNAATRRSTTDWHLCLHPRRSESGNQWFPLPSYIGGAGEQHHFGFPYWFLIMIYLGLWQLPWLFRYHRRKRIERSLTAPA